MNRRRFLRTAAASAASGSLLMACENPSSGAAVASKPVDLGRIGVGLFTIPFMLEQDFAGAIGTLAEIGYKEVEVFGPYPFSAQEAKDYWNALTDRLGFSGSGYFGHTPRDVRSILDEHGMTAPSMHVDIQTMETRLDELIEAAQILGHRYAGIAAIPEELRPDLDGYKRMADRFNEIGMRMSEAGMKALYHNHGYGLVEMEGEIPMQVILERTDPDYVAMEMDVYWTVAGRADPVAYLTEYPRHYKLMHVKDMSEVVHFEGSGSTAQEWMELFPYMSDAGSGVLDLTTILSTAKKNGVDHFFLERDLAAEPEATLQNSYSFLSAVEIG